MKNKSMQTERIFILVFLSFLFFIQIYTSISLQTSINSSQVSNKQGETKELDMVIDKESDEEKGVPQTALRDYTESYEFNEHPVYDDFTDPDRLAQWNPQYTIGSGASGFGYITVNTGLYMAGETQEVSVGGYTVPELPDSLSIQSGNLLNPDHPWGSGRLYTYFTPTGLSPLFKTYTINGIPIPYFLISKFAIYIRTDPNADPLANEIYSYSPGLGEENVPQEVLLQLDGAGATNYFEVIFYLLTYTKEQSVRISFIDINSYSMNWSEAIDYIPSDIDQNITVNFKQTFFNRDTNGATVEIFVNNYGPIVDASCLHYSAAGDNTNPYTIQISNTAYQAGDVYYRIRFRSAAGDYFWTPTYTFYCYDHDEPWFGTIANNTNHEYQNNLVINMPVYDTGGSHLKNAKIVWDFGKDPANDSSNYQWNVNTLSGDSGIAQFIIPSSSLQYSGSNGLLRFKIFVYDNAFWIEPDAITFNLSAIYAVNIVDNIAPHISINWADTSFYWSDTNGRYIQDLGYDLRVSFTVEEPAQASHIETSSNNFLYLAIQNDTMPTVAPWGLKYDIGTLHDTTFTYYFSLPPDFLLATGHWFWLTIFAQDKAGNNATNNKTYGIYMLDCRGPDITEGINNTRDPDFDKDYYLYFNCSEPAKALGVNSASKELKYIIGSYSNFDAEAQSAPLDADLSSGPYYIYSYRISKTAPGFQYGATITYRYRIYDLGGNGVEILRTMTITDRYVPDYNVLTDRSISNWSITYSFWDVSFVVDASDQLGGSGIDYLKCYLKNGSNAIYASGQPNQTPFSPYKIENGRYYFLFPETKISYHGISIVLRVYDKAGNYQEWMRNIDVQDNYRPEMVLYRLDVVNDIYLNKETTYFYFKLSQSAWVTCFVDGKTVKEMTATDNISTYITVKGEGIHYVSVQFNDFLWIKTFIVDLTAPGKAAVSVEKIGLLHQITWRVPPNITSDEKIRYLVYRGTTEDFTIENATFITETTGFLYAYPLDESGTFYYKVIAVDQALNYSPLSDASNKITQVKSTALATGLLIAGIAAALVLSSFVLVNRYKKFYGLDKIPTPRFVIKLKQGYMKTKHFVQKIGEKAHKYKIAFQFALQKNTTPNDLPPNSNVPAAQESKSPALETPKKMNSEELGWETEPAKPVKSEKWQDFSSREEGWEEEPKKTDHADLVKKQSKKAEIHEGWDESSEKNPDHSGWDDESDQK